MNIDGIKYKVISKILSVRLLIVWLIKKNSFCVTISWEKFTIRYDKMGSIMIVNNTRVNFFNLLSRITEPKMSKEMNIYKEFKVTALL